MISSKARDGGRHCSNDEESSSDLTFLPQIMDKYETRFLSVEQSELYRPAGMVIPKLPMYHPYHPFKNVANGDDILQVPLAIILPINCLDLAPLPLRECLKKNDITAPITPYFVAQTLPYDAGTNIICRYQYAMFPEAKGEMGGNESIWAQGIIYEGGEEIARLPSTQIKIYESDKGRDVSPTILCGDSMKLDIVENLRGRGIWSLALGSRTGELGEELFAEMSHVFFGFTYFIHDDDAYLDFIRSLRDKSSAEILSIALDICASNYMRK